MQTKKPIIAIDIDEVLAFFIPSLSTFHNEQYETSLTADSFHSYEFHHVWGGTKEDCSNKMELFFESDHFKENIKPVPDAYEILLQLKESYDLHIITARQYKIEDITLQWIHKHYPNIFTDVHFGNHYGKQGTSRTKPQMCQEIGACLLIDDSLIYATQCYHANIPILLFGNYAWNQLHSVPSSYHDGIQIYNYQELHINDINISLTTESYSSATTSTDIAIGSLSTTITSSTIKNNSDNSNNNNNNNSHSRIAATSQTPGIYRVTTWKEIPAAIAFLLASPGRVIKDKLIVAAIQMCSKNNKLYNLKLTNRLIKHALLWHHQKVELICLPECNAFMGASREETIAASEIIDVDTCYPKDQCKINFLADIEDDSCDKITLDYDGFSPINYIAGLCQIAFQNNVWISVGGFPEKLVTSSPTSSFHKENVSITNTTATTDIRRIEVDETVNMASSIANTHFLISPQGCIASPLYRKIHLFDAPIVNLYESKSTVAGDKMVLANINNEWNVGLTICYDLRFPQLFQSLRSPHQSIHPNSILTTSSLVNSTHSNDKVTSVVTSSATATLSTHSEQEGSDLILVPSAFICKTGIAHWEVLLRARAIETQCYVIAAAQAGQHNEKRTSYGHSMIIDPWGKIVSQLHDESEGVIYGEVDRSILHSLRQEMPVQAHRRVDLY